MKNKKICVGMFLALVAFSQEVCAMNAGRKIAQMAWSNKFALVGTGLVGNAVLEYKNARQQIKQQLIRIIKTSPIARVPEREAHRLFPSLTEVGATIPDMQLFFIRYQDDSLVPCIESGRIDNIVCFRINDAGQLALVSSTPNAFGFCADDLYPIIKHEKEHVEKRHIEQKVALKVAFTPFNFFTGVGAYKAVLYGAQKVAGIRSGAAACIAVGMGLGAYYCAHKSNFYVEKAHDRYCEKVADGAVLRADKKTIETQLSFFERSQEIDRQSKKEDPSFKTLEDIHPLSRPHLTDSERIEAARAELARREAAGR
jgi:hypothetical protein